MLLEVGKKEKKKKDWIAAAFKQTFRFLLFPVFCGMMQNLDKEEEEEKKKKREEKKRKDTETQGRRY